MFTRIPGTPMEACECVRHHHRMASPTSRRITHQCCYFRFRVTSHAADYEKLDTYFSISSSVLASSEFTGVLYTYTAGCYMIQGRTTVTGVNLTEAFRYFFGIKIMSATCYFGLRANC